VEIVFPRETHAAVNLDPAIADRTTGIAGIHFRDGNGGRCIRGIFFQCPPGVVHGGTGALCFQIHVRALVLHGLENSNWFAELFASLGIFHGEIECPLHSANQFGSQSGSGDVECSGEILR